MFQYLTYYGGKTTVLMAKAPHGVSCSCCFGMNNPELCGPFPCMSQNAVIVEDTPEGRARYIAHLLEK